jgi:uncharacterized delta-60 repeat protein
MSGWLKARLVAAMLCVVAMAITTSASAASPGFGFGKLAPGGPGDRIVAVGHPFAAARLDLDGSPDLRFGRRGFAQAGFPRYREGRAVDAVQLRGGAVVLGGYVVKRCGERPRGAHCGRLPALVRFDRNGRLDSGFGNGGKLVAPFSGSISALLPLPSGKLLVAGRTGAGLPLLARYTVSGGLDRSYGEKGRVVLHGLPGFGSLDFGHIDDMVEMPDRRVVARVYAKAPNRRRIGLARFGRQGELDRGFGGNGFVDEAPAGARMSEYGLGLAPSPDGKLLIATTTNDYPQHLVLFRLQPDGAIDLTYGEGGLARGPSSYDVRFNLDLVLRPDGGALVGIAGYGGAAIAAFLPGGAVDTTFASAGMTSPLESWGSHASLVVLADGSVVLADSTKQLSGLLIGRYRADGTPIFTTEVLG